MSLRHSDHTDTAGVVGLEASPAPPLGWAFSSLGTESQSGTLSFGYFLNEGIRKNPFSLHGLQKELFILILETEQGLRVKPAGKNVIV